MEIIARRMNNDGDCYWVFFEHGEINGKPLMMINEWMLCSKKSCLEREGFVLKEQSQDNHASTSQGRGAKAEARR